MEAPQRGILTKVSLFQPTQEAYIKIDKAMGQGYMRDAMINSSSSTPTYDRLLWGEFWLQSDTTQANQVKQEMQQALAPFADRIRALDVLVIHDPSEPEGSITWEDGWQKLRAAHTTTS